MGDERTSDVEGGQANVIKCSLQPPEELLFLGARECESAGEGLFFSIFAFLIFLVEHHADGRTHSLI